ncbi:YbhB/YbcL family Raf kinase inhibitor-like protein [Anaerosporobacter sp.]|uniref:YbhB/YbcL family Raf kinase inhibitor-like protein n=1 Tax=Anaerosporobacter sp. TaxID=1872529 RepID=UPI00286EC20C|nr:YbhB/YbcL family Raf kinase inhibitor-like protein [Anaerosporobacter sp.]
MKIKIKTENGYLPQRYSKYAEEPYKFKGNPIVSFPINFEEVPNGTKSFALTVIDYDAVPVCGFPWIHWIACDIPANISNLPENVSVNNTLGIIQGKNSFSSNFVGETDTKITCHYTGPTPPDKDHKYTVKVYALDCETLNLNNGFYLNELYDKVENHIVAVTSEQVIARY